MSLSGHQHCSKWPAKCSPPLVSLTPDIMCPSSPSHHCNREGSTLSRQHNPKPLSEKSQAGSSSLVTGCIFQNCFRFTKNRKKTDMSQTTPRLCVTHGTLGAQEMVPSLCGDIQLPQSSLPLLPALQDPSPQIYSHCHTTLPTSHMFQQS